MRSFKLNLVIILVMIAAMSFPQKRAFTIEDLYKVKNVSVPVLSNSGEKIAFAVSESDEQKWIFTDKCFRKN